MIRERKNGSRIKEQIKKYINHIYQKNESQDSFCANDFSRPALNAVVLPVQRAHNEFGSHKRNAVKVGEMI
jgi:hypothetical protein